MRVDNKNTSEVMKATQEKLSKIRQSIGYCDKCPELAYYWCGNHRLCDGCFEEYKIKTNE